VERRVERGLQHLGLPTACALVYSSVTGETLDARDAATMREVLNDVARALASLVTVYAPDPASPLPQGIAPLEVIEGRFARGAHVFITKDGAELRGLTVQRRDVWAAIAILKSSRVRFRRSASG
jgi:hypothetical protein